jgi:bla regulator protein BlaR1
MESGSLPSYMNSVLNSVAITATTQSRSATFVTVGLTIWVAGAVLMLARLSSRQIAFVRALGRLTPDQEGFRRSNATVAPMLVAAWRPHVVVPVDFEARYDHEEQRLVLAHERAHLLRRDLSINAIAAAWLCLSWFNPLIYWALGRLRFDQEVACDALVLARLGTAPRRYADALLKAQLASESVWRMPVGCYWQSSHPLKERIAMLKRPLPGFSRRLGGIGFAIALTLSGGYAVWAAQAEAQIKSTPILVNLKLTVTNSASAYVWSAATEYLVNSGEPAPYPAGGHAYDFRCAALLSGAGHIVLKCKISNNGEVVSTPSVVAVDGTPAAIEVDDPQNTYHYRLQLYATTSKEKIAAEKAAAPSR